MSPDRKPSITQVGIRLSLTNVRRSSFVAIGLLQQKALDFARRLLKPNGYFLCKLFHGQDTFTDMRLQLESLFRVVHHLKPSASREESAEMYLLGMQYFGSAPNTPEKSSTNQRIETDRKEIERLMDEARRVRTKNK